MKFLDIEQKLRKRITEPLIGEPAHAPLRATPVGQTIPNFKHGIPPRAGGVLIMLYEDNGELRFPLIKRAEYLGAHSGQISLPGGKAELGENIIETALREGEEEIGIRRGDLEVLGTLSNFFVIPSNFMVTPVLAVTDREPIFKPDPFEVAQILTCSIDDLIREDAIHEKEILAGGLYRMRAPHFEIQGEVVWGATAMMLNEFRLMLRELL